MTDAEILQSHIDHFSMTQDIMQMVQTNTPSRWRKVAKNGRRSSVVYDFAEDAYVVCRW